MDRSAAQTALLPASQALDPSSSVPDVLKRAGAKAWNRLAVWFRPVPPEAGPGQGATVRALLIGCEYAGTTTLAEGIRSWSRKAMGQGLVAYHDHWKIPHTSGHPGFDDENLFTPEEQQQILALSPKAKEMIQRHNMAYHTTPEALRSPDYLTIGLHIET